MGFICGHPCDPWSNGLDSGFDEGGGEFVGADGVEEAGAGGTGRGTESRGLDGRRDGGTGEKLVDRVRGFFAFADGVDDFAAAVRTVTAGENVREVRLAGEWIALDRAAGGDSQCREKLFEQGDLFFLTNRFEDEVEGLREFAVGDEVGFTVGVGDGVTEAQAADVAVGGEDFDGRGVEEEFDAVGLREFVFEFVGGHIVLAAPIDDGRAVGPEAEGLGGGIDGGVAATDDGDGAAGGDVCHGLGAELLDEVEGIANLGQIFAGDAEAVGFAEAEAEEERGVVALEVGEGNVAADGDAAAEFDAERFYEFDLGQADFGFQLVVSDAVGVEATGLRLLFKNGGVVAELGECGGATEAGGTGADDGDFAAGLDGGSGEDGEPAGLDVVGGVALETTDLDGLFIASFEDAGAFTEDGGRADAGAGSAEDIGRKNRASGANRIIVRDFFDESRDIDASRAGSDARGVKAVEATTRLDMRLLGVERGFELGEVDGEGGGGEQRLERHVREGSWRARRGHPRIRQSVGIAA